MSPRTDSFLRFPIDSRDQGRIATDALDFRVSDLPLRRDSTEPPYTYALRLEFRVNDPDTRPVWLRPAGPGWLTFIADPADERQMPRWDNIEFDAAHHANWPTRGMLRLELLPRADEWTSLSELHLRLKPTWLSYDPVCIPLEFLQTTLIARKVRIPGVGNEPTIETNNPNWAMHAAARFLQGRFHPELRLGVDQGSDDVARLPMPTVDMNEPTDSENYGRVSLTICAGQQTKPFDGPASLFNYAPGGTLSWALPGHPSTGCFPARYFFRGVRDGLIDGDVGGALPDLVLNESTAAPNYHIVRVTRTWKPVEECSVHFPQHTIKLERPGGGGGTVVEQWLPSHGVVFVPEDPAQPLGEVSVTLGGGQMRWLVPDDSSPAWQRIGEQTPATLNLLSNPPHVIARLPMREAMMVEKAHKAPLVDGQTPAVCTYYSLRRAVRAFADNRICGGRLNWPEPKVGQKRAVAQSLLLDAWSGRIEPTNTERVNDPATPQPPFLRDRPDLLLVNGAPSPAAVTSVEEIRRGSRSLLHVLRLFFPYPVAPDMPDLASHTLGENIYHLWQSAIDVFHHEDTRLNFEEIHIMRGAPGAMVAAGLAVFVGNHLRVAGETDAAYCNRVVNELLGANMERGDLLQFWSRITDFQAASRFGMPSNVVENGRPGWTLPGKLGPDPDGSYGHSPVFAGYTGAQVGTVMHVFDQYGESDVRITGGNNNRKLQWADEGGPELIWIAAKWTE